MGRFDEYLSDISELKREIRKRQDRIEFLRSDPFLVNQRRNRDEINRLEDEISELRSLLHRYRTS